jgi:outer membrane receptor protein involved in Fe transport
MAGFPGEGASYSSISQTATCAVANINSCANIRDGSGALVGLDVGSPLGLPLGTRDPSWISGSTPGIGGGLDGIPDIMFVNTVSPRNQKAEQYNGRLDYQATTKDLFAFSTYQTPVYTTSFNGPVRPANFWVNDRLNHAETLMWTRMISPTVINEARFSLSRWSWNEVESNPQEPWGLPVINIDSMNSAKVQNLGAPGPSIFAQTTYNFRDTATWVRGSHLIKFGGDLYWEQNNASRAWAARPTYMFRNIWDFANDAPYQETGTLDPRTGVPSVVRKYLRSGIFGFFVQDDWKFRPNLTINLGLRYEYFDPLSEKYGEISNAVLGTGADSLTGLRMQLGPTFSTCSTI